jgi:tRNA A-37 threonylcarbamoyl transferase component Bud32
MAVSTGVLPDRYADPRVIGRGGMGEIYLAEDTELSRKVVVKVLDERYADRADLRQRFKREALTAARLSGEPHTITIFDVGEFNDRPYIVMEYLPGGSLAEKARSGPVRHEQALEWLGQAGEAIDAAHARGVVHRDIKPANLLFNERGELEVADFGIARVIDDTTGMTAAGTVMGTAGYLAPEQARGEPATPASDRYGLGVVAYELLTGGRPFERGSETAEAAAHIHEPVPPASERGVGLSPAVDPVFERALAKNPGDRFRTSAEFVAALRGALQAEEAAPTRVFAAAAPGPAYGPERSRSRPVWLVPLLVAAFLVALGGGVTAAVLATGADPSANAPRPHDPVTVTRRATKTMPGTTVVSTVVTTVAAPSTTPAPEPNGGAAAASAVSVDEAVALTDQATGYLRSGDWKSAWKTVKRALPALAGTYRDDFRYEAYSAYDAGKALAELGRCQKALPLLERSEALQGSRSEIDDAKALCGA